MVQVKINRGGATVNLTPAQVQEAETLAQSSLEKGGSTIPFFGRDENVRKYGSFLVAEARRKNFNVQLNQAAFSRHDRELQMQQAQSNLEIRKQQGTTGVFQVDQQARQRQQAAAQQEVTLTNAQSIVSGALPGGALPSFIEATRTGAGFKGQDVSFFRGSEIGQGKGLFAVDSSGFEKVSRTKEAFRKTNTIVQSGTTGPVFSGLEKIGVTPERIGDFGGKLATSTFQTKTFGLDPTTKKDKSAFVSGSLQSVLTDVRDQPLKNIAFVGAGFGTGFAVKGIGLGAKATGGLIGGAKGAKVGSTLASVGVTGAGLGASGIFAFQTGNQLKEATSPKEKGAITGLAIKDVSLFSVGFAGGFKGFDVTKDLIRTRGLKELPLESVVAPEFLAGQRFPQIKKGQTAGQLKQEFSLPSLPTEKARIPRAFTASGQTFSSLTKTGRGTSEVPGLFGSPKVSATFLRTGGEKTKLFGLFTNLESTSPTALRLELKSLGLAPGVKSSQTKLAPVQKGFFESIGGTGRSVLPFMKTEKEVVTAFNTPIAVTKQNFFFKIGGRRVPIKEFSIIEQPKTTQVKTPKLDTLKNVASSSSRRIKGSSSIFNPVSVGSSFIFSRSSVRPSRSITSVKSAFKSPVSRPKPSSSKTLFGSSSTGRGRGSSSISSIFRTPPPSSRLFSFGGGSRTPLSSSPPPSIKTIYAKTPKRKKDRFTVEIRRRGKFKTIAQTSDLNRAFNIGKGRVEKTLAATFRVKGVGGLPSTPRGFRTKKEKGSLLFIQKRGFRLGSIGERREIKRSKRRK